MRDLISRRLKSTPVGQPLVLPLLVKRRLFCHLQKKKVMRRNGSKFLHHLHVCSNTNYFRFKYAQQTKQVQINDGRYGSNVRSETSSCDRRLVSIQYSPKPSAPQPTTVRYTPGPISSSLPGKQAGLTNLVYSTLLANLEQIHLIIERIRKSTD